MTMKFLKLREAKKLLQKMNGENSNLFGKNNKLVISGILKEDFKFAYKTGNDTFYATMLQIPRNAEEYDYIPISVNEKLIKSIKVSLKNQYVLICGEVRTYIKENNRGKKTHLYVLCKRIEVCSNETINFLKLKGHVQKLSFITTCYGKVIAKILLKVNGNLNTKYIDCVAWAEDFYHNLKVGDKVEIYGKIQNEIFLGKKHETIKSNESCIIWAIDVNYDDIK